MNELTEHDAAVSERLTNMQADGWQEVKAMDSSQLDAFMDELNGTGRRYDSTHPFVALRSEAVQAVQDVRHERQHTAFMRWSALTTRTANITGAAQKVREAIELIESASAVSADPEKPPAPPSPDVGNATDNELTAALTECLRIVRAEQERYADDAKAIALLKTPASKAIAAELKAKAKAYDERRAKADDLAHAIAAGRDRRAAERAEKESKQSPEALEERIALLESRLAEIGEAR